MKVFVTGASGFVGSEILSKLQQAGHFIRVLARDSRSSSAKNITARFSAEIHQGDVLDGTSLPGGLKNIDAVIHLVGIIGEVGKHTFENVHVNGTRNMVNATRQAGVRRYIQMSALGTRPNAIARYHQSKWAAEEIVRQSGLDFTIFRPSIIYGPRDHFVNLFARISRFSPVMPVTGSGRNQMQPIAVADVATCFVNALSEPKSIGQTFDLCGLERLTFNETLRAILKVTGRKRFLLHLPMTLARFQAALLEFIFPIFDKAPPLSRDQLLMLQEDNVGNPQLAIEMFGFKPVPFERGISEYLAPHSK